MTDHPITPPPELVEQWRDEWVKLLNPSCTVYQYIATQAARWGADQELEACCTDIHTVHGQHRADWLRSMRRPKPLSSKEEALKVLEALIEWLPIDDPEYQTLRHALEQLND